LIGYTQVSAKAQNLDSLIEIGASVVVSGSLALLSDAGHMLTDVGAIGGVAVSDQASGMRGCAALR
jgi:Co/Zn/Cd efflux system component